MFFGIEVSNFPLKPSRPILTEFILNSLDPTYVKALQRRATARTNLNRIDEAIEDYKRVLELEPQNKSAVAEIQKLEASKNPVVKESAASEQKSNFRSNLKAAFQPSNSADTASSSSSTSRPAKREKLDVVRPGQVFPIKKAPHLRSHAPMKRVEIIEVGNDHDEGMDTSESFELKMPSSSETNTTRGKKIIEIMEVDTNDKITENKENTSEVKKAAATETKSKGGTKSRGATKSVELEIIAAASQNKTLESDSTKSSSFSKPKSTVQFTNDWSTLKSDEERQGYLGMLESKDYSLIFKQNMEPTLFTEILATLSKIDSVAQHLLGLSRVPRISTIVLFLDDRDQKILQNLCEKMPPGLTDSEIQSINKHLLSK